MTPLPSPTSSSTPPDNTPVVLAFSGGLDTCYCVPVLREATGRPVVTVTVDTGGLDEAARAALTERSRALGAAAHHLTDARAAYFDDVLKFLIVGNVRRGQLYPLCVGAERVLQAREVARVARALGSKSVAHGSTAAGNDQIRFEVALRTLAPELEILAPVRDQPRARAEQVAELERRGLPVPPHGAAYSINRGLWGVTIGGRETLGTEQPLPESAWELSRGAFEAPRLAERHTVSFDGGIPVRWDGEALDPVALIERIDAAAAPFAIGRGIHLGETILGTKGRVAFEAPAAEVLLTAHRELEKLVLTQRQQRVKDHCAAIYGDLVHEGQWLDPVGRDLEALLESSQERVTGDVFLSFRTGSLFVEGVTSPYSLLKASRGRYGEAAADWTSEDARGYSRLLAMPGVLHTRAGQAATSQQVPASPSASAPSGGAS
jgi:argininosuccinate synthase